MIAYFAFPSHLLCHFALLRVIGCFARYIQYSRKSNQQKAIYPKTRHQTLWLCGQKINKRNNCPNLQIGEQPHLGIRGRAAQPICYTAEKENTVQQKNTTDQTERMLAVPKTRIDLIIPTGTHKTQSNCSCELLDWQMTT